MIVDQLLKYLSAFGGEAFGDAGLAAGFVLGAIVSTLFATFVFLVTLNKLALRLPLHYSRSAEKGLIGGKLAWIGLHRRSDHVASALTKTEATQDTLVMSPVGDNIPLSKDLEERTDGRIKKITLADGSEGRETAPRDDLEERHVKFFFPQVTDAETASRAAMYYHSLNRRRSCRYFSSRPVPVEAIRNCCLAASTGPSGAHTQPWTFVVVYDAEIKRQIRLAAEEEEKINYERRMADEWKDDLAHIGTDWQKEFLEVCPCLIVVFKQTYGEKDDGSKQQHYYFEKSVGIATGMLISAINASGLVTLTHTPTPMQFLHRILKRPTNEKPYILLPVGYPSSHAVVPELTRKPLEDIIVEM
eukprot:Clim_evm50s202 gene=Clim_evmTU50s202